MPLHTPQHLIQRSHHKCRGTEQNYRGSRPSADTIMAMACYNVNRTCRSKELCKGRERKEDKITVWTEKALSDKLRRAEKRKSWLHTVVPYGRLDHGIYLQVSLVWVTRGHRRKGNEIYRVMYIQRMN